MINRSWGHGQHISNVPAHGSRSFGYGAISNASMVIFTAGAGSKTYISNISVCVSTSSSGYGLMYIKNSGGVLVDYLINFLINTPGTICICESIIPTVKLDIGDQVIIQSTNGNTPISATCTTYIFNI